VYVNPKTVDWNLYFVIRFWRSRNATEEREERGLFNIDTFLCLNFVQAGVVITLKWEHSYVLISLGYCPAIRDVQARLLPVRGPWHLPACRPHIPLPLHCLSIPSFPFLSSTFPPLPSPPSLTFPSPTSP